MDDSKLKSQAKALLSHYYWIYLCGTLIYGVIVNAVTQIAVRFTGFSYQGNPESFISAANDNIALFSALYSVTLFFEIAIALFLFNPLLVGLNKFFIKSVQDNASIKNIFTSFKEDKYIKIVAACALKFVRVLLWALLLIIPGIIKSYEYYMVEYIIAENPYVGAKKALELSSKMTSGNKFRIFAFQLSFIGWYLLGLLACGIGIIFVTPYYYASMTQLYLQLKDEAIQNGTISAFDFNIIK